jgi:hypothetical protein
MALNRDTGEVIEGLGHMFRVVPTDKWATTEFGAPHFIRLKLAPSMRDTTAEKVRAFMANYDAEHSAEGRN